jgi:hypothetical protein
VLELKRLPARITACLGPAEELEGLSPSPGALLCRVAPDELLLVALDGGQPATGTAAVLSVDCSDGFAVWSLAGADADAAFARLSAIELPAERPAFLQGAVAGVPAKVLAENGRLVVLVASVLGHHLRERVRAACADFEPVEAPT